MRHQLVGFGRFLHRGLLIAAVVLLSLLQPPPADAASASAPTLIVRVYDAFGVDADELQQARTTLEGVLDAADVHVLWRHCRAAGPDPCRERPGSNELVIRLLRAPRVAGEVSRLPLGHSPLQQSSPTAQRRGSFATVYPDRVRTLARRADSHPGLLLGYAMAHEVGHLLLGTTSHPDGGLMRPHWTARQTRTASADDWQFLGEERTSIRSSVAVRTPLPASTETVARLDPPGRVTSDRRGEH